MKPDFPPESLGGNGRLEDPKDPWYWPGFDGTTSRSERPRTPHRRSPRPNRSDQANGGDERRIRQGEFGPSKPTPRPVSDSGERQTSQMADCVKGVLSRINEALTKLDRSSQDLPTFMDGGALQNGDWKVPHEEPLMSHRSTGHSRPVNRDCKSPTLVTPRVTGRPAGDVSKMRRTSGRGLARQVSMAGRLLAGACLLSPSWSFAAAPSTREEHRFFASKSQFSAGPTTWKIQRAATSAANNMDTSRSPQVLLQDAAKLLREVAEVATSTGMETGLRRGLQAAQAAAATAAEVAQQPPSQVDEAFIAKVLRKLFEKLGSTYVKLGQFIASSPTVFPAEYVKEFQACLDSTSTVSFVEVKRIIEGELGRPLRSVFAYVDPTPLASASIAQVHVGRLLNGTEVVIKVQKPGIEEVLKTDLGVVYLASRILEFINPDLNIRGSLADIASDLRESMLGELDFREEQRNLDVYREFLSSNGLDPLAVAPQPFPEASAKRVLTMERLTGVPLTDLEAIKRYSNDPEQTLVNALNVWALSVQKCEFFHADVHAGNLLVLEDGRVGFIDFGIVGRLSPKMATGIDKLNEALAVSDARGMAQALISMGATVGKVDEDAFAADIQQLIARLGGSLENATDATVDESQIQDIVLDIAQVAGNNGLKLPREFGLLIKQSLYFDRYTKLLAPELNMMSDDRISKFGAADAQEEVEVEAKFES
eukprot:symbB.v1.2.026915.t2/scaffold2727.1/size72105/2